MNGCTNPKAANYDPSATVDDGSCVYLEISGDTCVEFRDYTAVVDQSFTMSYSVEEKDWVFFHDYIPDFYFSTRKHLYSLKNGKIYKHNAGAPGVFYDTPKSFFVDAVFANAEDFTLNCIEWLTDAFTGVTEQPFQSLTHITVWNGQQSTGRIALDNLFHPEDLAYKEARKGQSLWSFNAVRDAVINYGSSFLGDIFNNFAVDATKIDMNLPWYEQKLLEGNYFIVRFEFDNTSGANIVLHAVDVNPSKTFR